MFRFLAQTIGLTRAPSAKPGSAERPLRVLLVASILLPVMAFAIAAKISYEHHFSEAHDRQIRSLNRVAEHAIKVFETFELSARYLEELFSGTSDAEIRQSEAEYSARLKSVTATLPQLRDLWLVGADGQPLVSGTVYPMPRIDLSDRDYFRVHRDRTTDGIYISDVLEARAAETRFFAISRRREIGSRFAGVTIVSIAPEYFTNYYAQLPRNEHNTAALVRDDGTVLARYPESTRAPARLPADGALMQAIRARPEIGTFTTRSAFDDTERTFAYRRLPRHGVYIITSFANSAVVQAWRGSIASHLVFGIPATFTMFGLGLVVLGRTRKLQREVARRESTEEALRQAQKMEAVGRLSGGIAHDFNNMLTVILGNIDIAFRRTDDPRLHRLLDSARQASERAATLVQRLLAFSRQHPQEVRTVDINRLVQGMSELLRRTIGEAVAIETVLAGGLWPIEVDPNQLENAIINLAVNGRDAMPDGGRLTIETANSYLDETYAAEHGGEIPHGQFVMVAVSDAGVGMSRHVLERAFEPFFTTKPTGMGTGLGLSMVYGFVKQSNGHVKIYTELNEGTTIKLYFPRAKAQSTAPEWPGHERGPSSTPALAGGTETILLVEDDEAVRRFAVEALREHGYRVHAASDAASALRLLDADPGIRLLFTDVVLPGGMNGRQLAHEALRRRADLRVLFATGYTRNAIIHQGRLDADVELLTKPFTAEAMARKIRQMLDAPAMASADSADAAR
jgi:two-component system NtrC family sensor kinase